MARRGEVGNSYKILVLKLVWRPLGKYLCRRKNNIKIGRRMGGCEFDLSDSE
jgi:hypothetical protein